LATVVPMLLVIIVKDMSGLADLYAVGVVGAIATNLGATSTDRKLSIKTWARTLMFGTFLVMAAIEMSLLIDKPNARYFASTIFAEAKQKAENITPLFCYAVSPSAAETIVDVAATLGASRVILGAPQRSALINLLRGNVIREVSNSLPEDIDLLVYA